MVSVHIHWDNTLGNIPTLHMLPSLSSTCPTTDTTESASSSGHETLSLSDRLSVSDLKPRAAKKMLTSKVKDEAIRFSKQQIRSKLREDWTWPPTTPSALDPSDPPDTFSEWRERDSDSSLPSPPRDSNPDPYKYDSPDSLHQPVLSRKRKRKRRLREEMEWNEGLRTYTERRDAWTGARTSLTLMAPSPSSPTFTSPFDSPYSQARTPISGTVSTPPSPPTVVPVAPPILPPDHPVRTAVQPATYAHIYSAVIVQSLAPAVPINLKDVVSACVAGWKKDGEWPPKSEAEKAILVAGTGEGVGMGTVSPGKAVRRSVGKVKRALGFRHGEDEGGEEEGEEEEEGKPF